MRYATTATTGPATPVSALSISLCNSAVRVASERKAVPVYAVADLSASMAYEGRFRKLDVLADFVEALAWSA